MAIESIYIIKDEDSGKTVSDGLASNDQVLLDEQKLLKQSIGGKLDNPVNEGSEDMVLTKTATGSEWKSIGLNYANQLATNLFNDISIVDTDVISQIVNGYTSATREVVDTVYSLYRVDGMFANMLGLWFRSVRRITSIYISNPDNNMADWLRNFNGYEIGYLDIKEGIFVHPSVLSWCRQVYKIKIRPSCIVVKGGDSLDLSKLGEDVASLIDVAFVSEIVNGLGTVTNASVAISQALKSKLTEKDMQVITGKGWSII